MENMAKQIERRNQQNVLHVIEQEGEISRAGVAKRLGLSRTTVSNAVVRLMETSLVQETVQAGALAGPGRPGIPLSLTENVWYAAGAAFIDQELLFALTDLRGRVVERVKVAVPDATSSTFLAKMVEGFALLLKKCPGRLLPMLGVGSPGMVNHGSIVRASDMDWDNVPIADTLKRELGYPSIVINRHWASCLSEYHFGAGRGVRSQIYVGVSTGIAASFITDGRLLTGAYHSAGEIGHTVVNRDGPRCICGKRGCLHAISSENALKTHVGEYYAAHPGPATEPDALWEIFRAGRAPDIDAICGAAAAGHPVALRELQTAALYLGLSIGNLVSMFNPQRVIVGGSLIDHGGELLTGLIIDSVREHASRDTPVAVEILPWALGRASGPLGAALMVLEEKRELAIKALGSRG